MSFKQAKELIERIELTDLTLKEAADNIDRSSKKFNESLKQQEYILKMIPQRESKYIFMKIVIALNIGFVLGLVAAKYIL